MFQQPYSPAPECVSGLGGFGVLCARAHGAAGAGTLDWAWETTDLTCQPGGPKPHTQVQAAAVSGQELPLGHS